MKYVQPCQPYNKKVVHLLLEAALGPSLACQSRRPHSHPNQHTEAELKLIRDMRRRNPSLGMIELWHRLRKRGYTRCPESLFRVMRKMGLFPAEKPKNPYKPKPYEQMTYPGQRVQVDVKVVPRRCIADPELRLFQYTAIDEFTRLRFLAAYPEVHLFLGGLQLRGVVRPQRHRSGVCPDGQRLRVHQPFLQQQARSAHAVRENCRRAGHPSQADPALYAKAQRKVERSHREDQPPRDQKTFYSCHSFYSLDDFAKQLPSVSAAPTTYP